MQWIISVLRWRDALLGEVSKHSDCTGENVGLIKWAVLTEETDYNICFFIMSQSIRVRGLPNQNHSWKSKHFRLLAKSLMWGAGPFQSPHLDFQNSGKKKVLYGPVVQFLEILSTKLVLTWFIRPSEGPWTWRPSVSMNEIRHCALWGYHSGLS
jgi:hypothetical protein